MKRVNGLVVIFALAALAGGGLITYGMIADHRWSARCAAVGGHNMKHDEGTILVPVGKVLVPERQYSDHCMVDGREVHV